MKLRRLSVIVTSVVVILLLQVFVGCTFSRMQITRVDSMPALPPSNADSVKLFNLGDMLPQHYQALGALYSRKTVSKTIEVPAERVIFADLTTQGAALGADAIVGAYSVLEKAEYSRWGSALAVKLLPPGAPVNRDTSSFIFSILPLINHDAKNPSAIQDDDYNVRHALQKELSLRGYYSPIADSKMTVSSVADFAALDSASLELLGGTDMRDVMLLSLEATKGLSLVLVSGSECLLNCLIYSKDLRKVIWEKSVTMSVIQGWITTTTEGGTRRNALIAAAKEISDSLPKRGSKVKLAPKKSK